MIKSCHLTILIYLFVSLLVSIRCYGQSRINEDSLLHVVANPDSVVALIQAHNRLSRFYLTNDTTKAIFHLRQLDSIATSENDTLAIIMTGDLWMRHYASVSKYDIAEAQAKENLRLSILLKKQRFVSNAYNAIGIIKGLKSENDSVIYYLDTSYRIALAFPKRDPLSLSGSLFNLGAAALRFSDFDLALEYFFESLDLAIESDDPQAISMTYNGIAIIYKKIGDTQLARLYLRQSLVYSESINDHYEMGDALHNIGGTYKETNLDSAIYFYYEALKSYEKIGDKEKIGISTMAIGDALIEMKKPKEALRQFYRAQDMYQATSNRRRTIDAQSRLAKANYEMGNLKEASKYIIDVVQYYEDQKDLESSTKAYSLKSKILEGIGDHKNAVVALRHHLLLKDSLDSKIYNKEVKEIQTEFETTKKENEIARQQLTISNQISEKRSLTIGSVLGALLLSSIIIGLFQRSKKNKKLSSQLSLIQTQKIQQLEKEKKILSMNAMIEGQEAERSRIAKDLHDGLGGLLSTVKAHFSNIQSEIQKLEKINVYNRANELVDEACDEVRRISHNLMPGALMLQGLKTAVEHLGEEMSAAHTFAVRVETMGMKTRMEESKEVFVYRIIQEALNNIIKHAEASDVLIQLSETNDEYHFIVEDDGKGFDPLQIDSGLGLKSIQSRVDFLKGSLDVDTREGVGTTLSWHIPKSETAKPTS